MSILKRPIVTEKTNAYSEKGLPKYGFEVDLKATKEEVRAEVERIYGVKVEEVNTLIVRGKRRTRMTKKGVLEGKSSNFKKAIVTLAASEEIDFFKHI
ncbi:MAG: 50S ribosomal protein L23 [Bacteroidia bacterium]|jgi:large subunit ribosomal protein L23|nr:50S ribosomal protein L23 [Bacteroidia bacterium]